GWGRWRDRDARRGARVRRRLRSWPQTRACPGVLRQPALTYRHRRVGAGGQERPLDQGPPAAGPVSPLWGECSMLGAVCVEQGPADPLDQLGGEVIAVQIGGDDALVEQD